MSQATADNPLVVSEPFGQGGVLRLVRPALLVCSVLCLAISLVMWVRSHQVIDEFWKPGTRAGWVVRSVYGRLMVQRLVYVQPNPPDGAGVWTYAIRPMPRRVADGWPDGWAKRLGAGYGVDPGGGGVAEVQWVRIRWPLLVLVTAVLPLQSIVTHWRRDRDPDDA